MRAEEARFLLGLEPGYSSVDLKRARRAALLEAHPDRGGTRERLDRVHAAFAVLSDDVARRVPREPTGLVRRDCPSFTIDLLPVEAYECLLLAAAELGEVIDDEPPYRLEVAMFAPFSEWVIFEVVPDAGSSTVTVAIDGKPEHSIESIRDVWVTVLNGLQRP